jgi:ArsR family transcriptional regulator
MSFPASYFKADFFKVLSSPLRIQILDALRGGERSVNDIAQGLEVEATSVSQQLAILRRHNLLKTRRQGNYVFYAIRDSAIFTVLDAALVVFNNHLVNVQDTLKNLEDE